MSLSSSHVQRGPVHFGAGVSADACSQQDVRCGVMTVLSGQVEGGRPQLFETQEESHTGEAHMKTLSVMLSLCERNNAEIFINVFLKNKIKLSTRRQRHVSYPVRRERSSVGHQVPDLVVVPFSSRIQQPLPQVHE